MAISKVSSLTYSDKEDYNIEYVYSVKQNCKCFECKKDFELNDGYIAYNENNTEDFSCIVFCNKCGKQNKIEYEKKLEAEKQQKAEQKKLEQEKKRESERKRKESLKKCTELAEAIISTLPENEQEFLSTATIDYKLVYLIKNYQNKDVLDSLFELYKGLVIKQMVRLFKIAKDNSLTGYLTWNTTEKKGQVYYENEAYLTMKKTLNKIDLNKLGQRNTNRQPHHEWKIEEIKDEKTNKTIKKKVKTDRIRSFYPEDHSPVTPQTYEFKLRFNAYLVGQNKHFLNVARKEKEKKLADSGTALENLVAKNDENKKTDIRLSLQAMVDRNEFTERQYKLYLFYADAFNVPQDFIDKLSDQKKFLEEREKRKTYSHFFSQKELSLITGISETIISRDFKTIRRVIAELNGIQHKPKVTKQPKTPEEAKKIAAQIEKQKQLLERHNEILRLHNIGKKNKEIAEELGISKFIVSKELHK